MSTSALTLAYKAKGPLAFLNRARLLANRYHFTASQMDRALDRFSVILRDFQCGATFPLTAVALERNPTVIQKYCHQNIEFAVHGYTHVDYSRLTAQQQQAHLQRACQVFRKFGLTAAGFRSPYLSGRPQLAEALERAGFTYVSNQPVWWDMPDHGALDAAAQANLERAVDFYRPWRMEDRQSYPSQRGKIIEIPVSLPDDEILVDRLGGTPALIAQTWLQILRQTYQRGELFTLQLHPERIRLCAEALGALLSEARACTPRVWIARLDEIAAWWNNWLSASVEVTPLGEGQYHLKVSGPAELTVLVRGGGIRAQTGASAWADGCQRVTSTDFTLAAPARPIIGISPASPGSLKLFLRQNGYLAEVSPDRQNYTCYLDLDQFEVGQERLVLNQIKASGGVLARLGCWPNGAKSALAVTGDIDALSLWDYGLRMIGH